MLIDCDGCVMRDRACATCVVSVILDAPPGAIEVDESEHRALDALAAEGLVPALRLVPIGPPGPLGSPGSDGTHRRAGWGRATG